MEEIIWVWSVFWTLYLILNALIMIQNRKTYIPFWNGTEWIPSPNYNDPVKGPGWRSYGWKPIRIRHDKLSGNADRVVGNVLKSIVDNISIDDLKQLIGE